MKNKIYIIHENDEWVEPLRKELNDIKNMAILQHGSNTIKLGSFVLKNTELN